MARKIILLLNELNVRGSIWPFIYNTPTPWKKSTHHTLLKKKRNHVDFLCVCHAVQSYNFEKWK